MIFFPLHINNTFLSFSAYKLAQISPNLKWPFDHLKIPSYFFFPYPTNLLKQVICTHMHAMSLNLVSSPPGRLLKSPCWRSLWTSYFSVPVSGSLGDFCSTSGVWDKKLHLYLLSIPCTSGASLMDWSCPASHMPSSCVIVCELKTLAAQSPVCTCPLVISAWKVQGPHHLLMELLFQPLVPVACCWFPSGTFLTFYGCSSLGLTPRTLCLPPWLLCPQEDMLLGR